MTKATDGGGPRPAQDPLLVGFLTAPDSADFLRALPYNAAPSTDDKPFFFYNLYPSQLPAVVGELRALEVNNLGVALLVLLLVFSTFLTLLFIVFPLIVVERAVFRSSQLRPTLRILGYFICLGLGFMMVEIGFIQQFVLFLGHPIYALAVVLATLLAASGLGSASSAALVARYGATGVVRRAVIALAALMSLYAAGLNPLFRAALATPISTRIGLAVLLIAPAAWLMGLLLPAGMIAARAISDRTVPWAWGLNGAASVVGSMLSLLVAMNFGFAASLLSGMAIYALSAVFYGQVPKTNLTPPH